MTTQYIVRAHLGPSRMRPLHFPHTSKGTSDEDHRPLLPQEGGPRVSGRRHKGQGAGPEEKYSAQHFQLRLEHPRVLRLADLITATYPEFRKRALKAAMLYAEGHVHTNGAPRCFDVDSQGGGCRYHVDLNFSTCTCPDWEGALLGHHHSAPWCNDQPMCKHLVAAHLFEMLS
jgi:hypothetical protein